MFRNSLIEFIEQQKAKIHDDKKNLDLLDDKENEVTEDSMLKHDKRHSNNQKLKVSTQPFLEFGEYEQRRQILLQERKEDYQQYIDKIKHPTIQKNNYFRNRVQERKTQSCDKVVQTDIQGINSKLVQYDYSSKFAVEKDLTPVVGNSPVIFGHHTNLNMDRLPVDHYTTPKFNKFSPREKLMADLKGSHFSNLLSDSPTTRDYAYTKFSQDRAVKIQKQEKYLAELRHQIEEKQRMLAFQREQEKREEDFEIHKIESQLKETQLEERRASADRYFSKNFEMNTRYKPKKFTSMSDINFDNNTYRSQISDGSLTSRFDYGDQKFSKYSYQNTQPLIRHEKKPYSFNIPSTSMFYNTSPRRKSDNYTNTSSLYESALKSPKKLTNKYDESLPIPVLKSKSSVAKDLKHSIVVQSKSSMATRKLEDKWQIPAVRRNIITSTTSSDGDSQSILTQLGAIRLQLQQEQLRLDETLRNRGSSQTSVI